LTVALIAGNISSILQYYCDISAISYAIKVCLIKLIIYYNKVLYSSITY